jgi:hypothetical protein
MASNPDRPQFQDTIDEAWGQSVADHVVRRYPDAAARDADLALPPAELAGQVVAIGPAAGPVHLQCHDGATWVELVAASQAPYRVIGQNANVNTDAWGNWNINLPAGAKLQSATAVASQEGNQLLMVRHLGNGPDNGARVSFRAWWTMTATNPTNTTIGVSYIAVYTL